MSWNYFLFCWQGFMTCTRTSGAVLTWWHFIIDMSLWRSSRIPWTIRHVRLNSVWISSPPCSFSPKPNLNFLSSTVAQWLALLPHSKKVLGSSPDLSVWSWHVLPVFAWVSSGYSGFLPHQKTRILYSCHCPVTKALALELELVPGRCTVAAHCSWLV